MATQELDTLTIFYPAFNEEAYIERAVEAACEVGDFMVKSKSIASYEILIIDDASSDKTAEIADELAKNNKHINCIHHKTNRGLGGAMKSGFNNAKSSIVIYSDIDLPFDMMEIEKAYRLMRYYDADVVSAYRFDRTSEGPRRLIYSRIYNTLVMTVFGLRLKDVNFAFKLVRRKVLESMTLESEGSFIDVELLAKADRLGFNIIQFGTNYFHRSVGVSTLSSWGVIFKILGEMFSLYKDIKKIKPLKGNEKISNS